MMKKLEKYLFLGLFLASSMVFLSACSPEVGSKDWCQMLKEKPKGDWTANEATEYAKSCLF
ncbi:conserved exported hypothetical protein [Candidatus Terasakiella magnetica]|uniref:DUF3012 domain-containing protein n=1 Tax=Candidatus Terasakiella magnetica TaxID=1867952 RepID=A0A1C3RER1_9PROT|nr:DUF3012 domain-containing protein [Candidatus Terasakiella magnetica]SCA55770.1 conserved exported hypothetical protein [Candidatus Terasakiella magnetica]